MLELMVALVVFGIGLSGLYPLMVIQSRQLAKLESRFSATATYYVIPSPDAWSRKLGAAAQLLIQDPGPPAPPPIMILNNGDAGYSESGTGWGVETRKQAFRGDHRTHPAGTGANTATFAFQGLAPGWYDVQVTWDSSPSYASNTPFMVYTGSTQLGSALVDQQVDPLGGVVESVSWQSLGTFSIQGTSLQVSLSDNANGRVVADGARIVPVRNIVTVNSVTRTLAQDALTVHVSVTVKVPQ
jgi:hypothetical protein